MRPLITSLALLICLLSVPVAAASEDESVAAVFIFGKAGSSLATGFAVGDGSYIVTTSQAAFEIAPNGKPLPVTRVAVASKWTGDVYPAKVIAVNEQAKIALLKIATPAVPPLPLADDKVFTRVRKATLGQLLSGEEFGSAFQSTLHGIKVKTKPAKVEIKSWKGTNAFFTEIRDINWLYLTKVNPPEKVSKAALVSQPGVGVIGVFIQRLLLEGGASTPVFYQVYPAPALRDFLVKAGVPANTLSQAVTVGKKAEDGEAGFQSMSIALLALSSGSIDADDAAEAAVKIRPNSAMAHMLYGLALARLNKLEKAISSFDKAIELDPSLPDARLNRGIAYAAAGKIAEAEQDLRKAILDDPKDTRPIIALAGLFLQNENKLDEALRLAKDAISIAPDDPSCRIFLARVLKRKKDYDGAIKELRAVVDSAPNWDEPRVALGVTYEAAGKLDMAEAEYRKLVELMPNDPDVHLVLIEFLISADKKDEAKKAISKIRELNLMPSVEEAVKKFESKLDEGEKKEQPAS